MATIFPTEEQLKSAEINPPEVSLTPEQFPALQQEFAANPDLNMDAAIGNVLTSRSAREQMGRAGTDLDLAGSEFSGSPPTAPTANQGTAGTQADANLTSEVPEGKLTDEQQLAFNRQRDLDQRSYDAFTQQTQAEVNRQVRLAQESQAQARGGAAVQLARMGALNVTTAGISYLNDLYVRHTREINDLRAKGMEIIERAKTAKDAADLKTLQEEMKAIDANRKAIQDARNSYFDNLKKMQEIEKFRRDNLTESLDLMGKSGLTASDLPGGYLENLDNQLNLAPGTSAGILDFARTEHALSRSKTEAEVSKVWADQGIALQELLNKTPQGEEIVINGVSYGRGRSRGDLQTFTETDGNGLLTGITFNKTTGQWNTQPLGYIGAKKDGYTRVVDKYGDPWNWNAQTGQYFYAGVPSTNWEKVAPTGSVWDNNGKRTMNIGECGAFVNDLTGLGVGDTLESKKAKTDPNLGTKENPLQIGDVIVQSMGTTGHVSIIRDINIGPDGRMQFTLSESNYGGDKKVTNDRQMWEDDTSIVGYARGRLDPRLTSGPDAPEFFPGGATSPESGKPVTVSVGKESSLLQYDAKTGKWSTVKEPVSGPGVPSFQSSAIADAANSVAINLPKAQGEVFSSNLQGAVVSGDNERIKEILRQGVRASLDAPQRSSYDGRIVTIDAMKNIASTIKEYEAAGGDMGFLRGTWTNLINKIGQITSPALVDIATRMQMALIDYRRAISGAAFTESEMKQYEAIFPTVAGQAELNTQKAETLMDVLQRNNASALGAVIGKSSYDALYGVGTQIRVKVKSTGQTGTIESGEFDPAIYERL